MEHKIIKYGNHIINDNTNGYVYTYNSSDSYNFNSHLHKCYEFIHIIKGNLLYTVEGKNYTLSDGDIILTNPDELHSFSFPEKCFYQREFLHIYPGFLSSFPEILDFLNSRRKGDFNLIPSSLVQSYGLDKTFQSMESCCFAPDSDTHLLMLTYSLQLILQIKRILTKETIEYDHPALNTKSDLIRKFIDNNYQRHITVPDIAAAVFMSTAYASRLFKKETGMTIKAYLNLRRITYAKNLILEGCKATSIYSQCGFCDYSTFYRTFVKFVGLTPEDFKNTKTLPQVSQNPQNIQFS